MDVAVPTNMRVGLAQDVVAERGWALSAEQVKGSLGRPEIALIDLREEQERRKEGVIPGSLHVPYPRLEGELEEGGLLQQLAKDTGKRLIFYCAFGERSAMAVQAAQRAGLNASRHMQGGLQAWKSVGGSLRN
jgi:rhodanese-related sulfurtransferase